MKTVLVCLCAVVTATSVKALVTKTIHSTAPDEILLCPGESIEITFETTAQKFLEDPKPVGVDLEYHYYGITTAAFIFADWAEGTGKLKTNPNTGKVKVKLTPKDPVGTLLVYEIYWFENGKRSCGTSFKLYIVPCDNKVHPFPKVAESKKWLDQSDKLVRAAVATSTENDTRAAIAAIQGHLEKSKTGKRCTTAIVKSAVTELDALLSAKKQDLSIQHLGKVMNVRREMTRDILDELGKLDSTIDPSRWILDRIKTATDAQLLELLAMVEAANEEHFRQILVAADLQIKTPPTIIYVEKTNQGFRAFSYTSTLKGTPKLAQAFLFDCSQDKYEQAGILRAPDLIGNELRNRVAKLKGDERKLVASAADRADRLARRVSAGNTIVEQTRKLETSTKSNNAKGIADAEREIARSKAIISDRK